MIFHDEPQPTEPAGEITAVDDDAMLLHRLKQMRPAGRLALCGEGLDQYQWADAGHLLRYILRGEAK